MPSPRFLVIHGHFYQPPRENPWTGSVARQPSAAPFHDWNERINRECYAPNARARVLGEGGRIARIVNNYSSLNFNIGPTLMSWLAGADPATLALVVEADRLAAARHGGHGPAVAQVFNHIIMPLANARDQATQVRWGRRWFEGTFGRRPEGMWLAETAVDTASLKALAAEGVRFTILAQGQIDSVRPLGSPNPFIPAHGNVDPREPYRVILGPGPNDFIDVVVYDGPVSRAVAFENLLADGQALKRRIEAAFGSPLPGDRPRLVSLATDGESYGHHFRFGEMALAWLIDNLEREQDPDPIVMTSYAGFLAQYPPRLEARIVERSSWSCAHGVERWRSDCGCNVGSGPGWNQRWRAPLREGLDRLRDELAVIFERGAGELLRDPWAARDDYVEVLLARGSAAALEGLLSRHAVRSLSEEERREAARHLEAQLMSLYMFTSCAWFFDDLAGLEPVQNLRYALRAVELAGGSEAPRLIEGLLTHLRRAVPNDPDYPDGEAVWNRLVVPAALSTSLAAAHWAAARTLDVPHALGELGGIEFKELRVSPSEAPDGSRSLSAAVAVADPRLDPVGRPVECSASTGPGGRDLRIVVSESGLVSGPGQGGGGGQRSGPGQNGGGVGGGELGQRGESGHESPVETYGLDDLWPGVREAILGELTRDFFNELRERTLRSFEVSKNLLVQYGKAKRDLDWLGGFVFRVVAESRLEEFLWPMGQGYPVDLERLAQLLADPEIGPSLKRETALIGAAQEYLENLLSRIGAPGERPTILTELADLAALLKSSNLHIDYWRAQNLWLDLAARANGLWADPGSRRELVRLGELLNISAERFQPLS